MTLAFAKVTPGLGNFCDRAILCIDVEAHELSRANAQFVRRECLCISMRGGLAYSLKNIVICKILNIFHSVLGNFMADAIVYCTLYTIISCHSIKGKGSFYVVDEVYIWMLKVVLDRI